MKTRIVSAAVAVLVLIAMYYFLRTDGLLVLCWLVAFGCLIEYTRLAFAGHEGPFHLRLIFVFLCIGVFAGSWISDRAGLISIVISSVAFLTMVLLTVHKKEDLAGALKLQSLGLLGFLYCGLMPGLATRLLRLEHGDAWLFGLMAIVFSGDTFAYFAGSRFGKARLLEAVSPKKSVEGAIGGLVGSGLAGWALSYFVPGQSAMLLVAGAVVTGVFAQVGDLFESLLKRVADVKDSGSIMPGHGGILDRCDGIYFAAPIYFVLVRFLTGF